METSLLIGLGGVVFGSVITLIIEHWLGARLKRHGRRRRAFSAPIQVVLDPERNTGVSHPGVVLIMEITNTASEGLRLAFMPVVKWKGNMLDKVKRWIKPNINGTEIINLNAVDKWYIVLNNQKSVKLQYLFSKGIGIRDCLQIRYEFKTESKLDQFLDGDWNEMGFLDIYDSFYGVSRKTIEDQLKPFREKWPQG